MSSPSVGSSSTSNRASYKPRCTPSGAFVVPKAVRRPRASMEAMASAVLLAGLGRLRFVGLRLRGVLLLLLVGAVEQFFRFQPEPLDRRGNPRPLLAQELPPLAFEQQLARALVKIGRAHV